MAVELSQQSPPLSIHDIHDVFHKTLKFTSDNAKAGGVPIPINYNIGTYTIIANVDLFMKR